MSILQSRKIILSLHQKTAMIKYHVTLTEAERTELLNITSVTSTLQSRK
jgi:hypothetical protein